jgi:hypothetical protein
MRPVRVFYIISSDEDERKLSMEMSDWWFEEGVFKRRLTVIPFRELDYTGLVPDIIMFDPTAENHRKHSEFVARLRALYAEAHIILLSAPGSLRREEIFDLLALGANVYMEKRYEDISKVLNYRTKRIRIQEITDAAEERAIRLRKEKRLASAA